MHERLFDTTKSPNAKRRTLPRVAREARSVTAESYGDFVNIAKRLREIKRVTLERIARNAEEAVTRVATYASSFPVTERDSLQ